jgi:hypothetical protein
MQLADDTAYLKNFYAQQIEQTHPVVDKKLS